MLPQFRKSLLPCPNGPNGVPSPLLNTDNREPLDNRPYITCDPECYVRGLFLGSSCTLVPGNPTARNLTAVYFQSWCALFIYLFCCLVELLTAHPAGPGSDAPTPFDSASCLQLLLSPAGARQPEALSNTWIRSLSGWCALINSLFGRPVIDAHAA